MSLHSQTAQRLGLFLVASLGVFSAVIAGNSIADEDYIPIFGIIALLLVGLFIFGLGQSVYAVIPVTWGLTGSILALGIPFTVRQIVVLLALVPFIADVIFKRGKAKTTFESVDFWIWVNLGWLALVFIRNPVGIAALGGSARVGGKDYVDVTLACMAYLMLSRLNISPRFAIRLPLYTLGIVGFNAFAGAVGLYLPSVGVQLARLYSSFSPSSLDVFERGGEGNILGETRLDFLMPLGVSICLFVVSNINPSGLLHPYNIRYLASYVLGVICVLLSGFRNALFNVFLISGLSMVIRDRVTGIAKLAFVLLSVATLGVLLSYSSIHLPFTFQRALSFLPGNWDIEAAEAAKQSSEWRFQIWEIALTSDKYIRNKMFGDGFGYLREDHERMEAVRMGLASFDAQLGGLEAFLLNGNFHSGPVSSIRFVGAVGLLLFFPLLIANALYAIRLIRAAFGSEMLPSCFYYGLPAMVLPPFFFLIFGDYRNDFITILFTVGVLKMLRKCLESHLQQSGKNLKSNQSSPVPV